MAEGFSADGWASFQRVFDMGSTGKECDLGRERNSHHWSGSSSPIGSTGSSKEERELAKIEIRFRKTELVLELDVIGNVIEEVVDLAGTVPYPSTGDDHSNDCCYADPFLQCSCEQRHLVPNEDVSNHGLLRKSESL
ncbi:hypothetical protein TNCV_4322761 [Trichonephila clavipes]|nr:hypothetical protein TNCV_4322761 [Trichonephila clavipes]